MPDPGQRSWTDPDSARSLLDCSSIPDTHRTARAVSCGMIQTRISRQRAGSPASQGVQLRDNVLAIVAHDLRTPLATISMAADLLRDDEADERRLHFLAMIRAAAHQADRLISDLIDVTRIEAGKLSLESQAEPLAYLLKSATEMFAPQADHQGIMLVADVTNVRGISVRVDYARVMQLLANLISNALKFTAGGGSVVVDAAVAGHYARVSVRDTGIGIAPDELPHVFERFWQAAHHKRAGAGLGLAIAKGIVEAHDGQVEVTSAPGMGSTFSFTLPLAT